MGRLNGDFAWQRNGVFGMNTTECPYSQGRHLRGNKIMAGWDVAQDVKKINLEIQRVRTFLL
jgi:coenzyme F420-reducing hydrogenase delta subunit